MTSLALRDIYQRHLERIRLKKEPINVYFHVNQASKWSYRHLFELMTEHPKFHPTVFLVPELLADRSEPDHAGQMQRLCRFFSERNIPFQVGYDVKTRMFYDMFFDAGNSPDVVFYTQLWDTIPEHQPMYVSQRALTCDCLYHAAIAQYGMAKIEHQYYSSLWRFFASTPQCKSRHLAMFPALAPEQVLVTGWPRLDPYYQKEKTPVSKIWSDDMCPSRIIWAPHWTFGDSPDIIRFGTFTWSSQRLLELAAKYSNTLWIVKPHPTLRKTLDKLSPNGYSNFVKSWESLPNVSFYEDGDYFDLFQTSTAMITDSVSFLAEYLLTGHPLIHITDEGTAPLLSPGPEIVSSFYQAKNSDELQRQFTEVIINRNDTKYAHRLEAQSYYYTPVRPAGEQVFQYLKREFHVAD